MRIFAIGISHSRAPLKVRALLAFTKKRQTEILKYIKRNLADECVVLSTCNRCEFYLAADGDVREKFIEYFNSLAGIDLSPYITVFYDADAVARLAETAAGLDSMIIGEDQILGQVRDAHSLAAEAGTAGIYMNTLFRLAVTGAKRVKTDTLLSKTPVSTATLAIKKCAEALGGLDGKKIMIIGAGGKIGNIVYKDLASIGAAKLYVTTRTKDAALFESFDRTEVIDYYSRYDFLDDMDAVISATASPHLTISRAECEKALATRKKRAFIDLAVPCDMDIVNSDLNMYTDIDDLRGLSEENNAKKRAEAEKARVILEKYVNEFLVWQIFYENKEWIETKKNSLAESARGGFMKMIYEKKSNCSAKEFRLFIDGLRNEK